jgi:hypothetical protein
MMITVLACAAVTTPAGIAADAKTGESSDRAQVAKFLQEHVISKTVVTPKVTSKQDEGRMESDYEDQTTFTNFTESAQGFAFDITIVSKETRYDLDKDGKRVGPGRDLSGTEVYRYEVIERVSTKKLTGTVVLVSMTTRAPSRAGAALLVTGMNVVDGKLTWKETLPGYLDLVTARGKYKPGSWDSINTFSLVDGRLRCEYDITNFNVDPDTLQRTPMKERPQLLVATESDGK